MSALSNDEHKVAGSIKFNASVPRAQVLQFVTEMKAADAAYRLHARAAGDDGTHYITFEHALPDGSKEASDKVVDHFLQFFRNRLGVDRKKPTVPLGTKGWSISTVLASA